MDLSTNKIVKMAEDNATLIALLGTAYLRNNEIKASLTQLIANIPHEIEWTFTNFENIKYKFWDAPHIGTSVFKVSAAIWALGQVFDIIPKRYVDLAGKVALGAGATVLIMPASPGPSGKPNESLNNNSSSISERYRDGVMG